MRLSAALGLLCCLVAAATATARGPAVRVSNHIVGGSRVQITQAPWTVKVTNSVVRQQYVNAAAHHATIVRMRALPSGRYKTCLSSSAQPPYLPAKVCIRQRVS
jgi:hypothetical protein